MEIVRSRPSDWSDEFAVWAYLERLKAAITESGYTYTVDEPRGVKGREGKE